MVRTQMPAFESEPLPAFVAMRDVEWWPWPSTRKASEIELDARLLRTRGKRFGAMHAAARLDGGEIVCSADLFFSFLSPAAITKE
jgi:hypothetical protein